MFLYPSHQRCTFSELVELLTSISFQLGVVKFELTHSQGRVNYCHASSPIGAYVGQVQTISRKASDRHCMRGWR